MDYVQITPKQRTEMLRAVGAGGIDDLLRPLFGGGTRPTPRPLELLPALDELSLRAHVTALAGRNVTIREKVCFLGAGAYDHFIPAVVDALAGKAEFLTAYSPYQPEASQGALQAFFEWQTMLCRLTGMEVASISLYDGAHALAEAAVMAINVTGKHEVIVSAGVHPHYRAVLRTRLADLPNARYTEIPLKDGVVDTMELEDELEEDTAAVVVQSPNFFGCVERVETVAKFAHANESLMIQVFSPLSLGLLKHPGEMDVDVAVAEGQPLGIPVNYGGPYLGLLASKATYVRKVPGHIVGQTVDADGNRAFCLTLQAREQHVRRERANSNVSTNEGLMALRAAIYLAAQGPTGLRETAQCCHSKAAYLVAQLESRGIRRRHPDRPYFNEVLVRLDEPVQAALARADAAGILAGYAVGDHYPDRADCLLIAVTERRTKAEMDRLVEILSAGSGEIRVTNDPQKLIFEISSPGARACDTPPCDVPHVEIDPSIGSYIETELPELGQLDLVRHYTRLSNRVFCVDTNFYPLGSCTMKYNPKVNERLSRHSGWEWLHPLQRDDDCQGALSLLYHLRLMLQEIAGLHEVCLHPAAGAHGQWAVLRMVLAHMQDWGQPHRRTVLTAETAHGTNPASAAAAGTTVVTVRNGPDGLLDVEHLQQRLAEHDVAALMLAQPNTSGKFDPRFREIVDLVHAAGAMVYMDGANLNAMIGLARAGDFGVDAMHFGTHLSLGTPHGCGGPGAGPIAVNEKLAPYLPAPQVVERGGRYAWDFDRPKSIGRIHAFYGQFTVLVRAYAYLRTLGADGLRHVSETAVLCANYLAQKIRDVYPLPFGPPPGEPMAADPCAHGFVAMPGALLDRGITTMDIAKALIDRGIHPPTVHWPLPDCLTIEPTETESKATLDAFAATLLEIADQSAKDPEALRQAPTRAPVRRVDEIAAARNPVLVWKPDVG